nr:baseplate J/gp47 family protein [uncultured Lichenicoccus sp.]
MALSLQSFTTLVTNSAAAVQGACSTLIDLTVGSVVRAILEANAAVALWIQYLILQVLALTRLASSSGTDVDSFVADYGLTRLPGVAASGSIQMTSLSPGSTSATVPVGATVRMGSIIYAVVADTTQAAYSSGSNAYLRPVGTASILVTVQCTTTGVAGNAAAGAINLLGTAISGIDTVTNLLPFVNGSASETDAALRVRFAGYFTTLASGTVAAVNQAAASLQTGLLYANADQTDPSGNYRGGYFTEIIDNGTGSPPASLIASVYAAINAVRACGVGFAVQGPSLVTANVTMAITIQAPGSNSAISTAVTNAITADIDATAIGAVYDYSRLAYIAYTVGGANVTGVPTVLLNGGTANLGGTGETAVRAGTINVTVTGGNA